MDLKEGFVYLTSRVCNALPTCLLALRLVCFLQITKPSEHTNTQTEKKKKKKRMRKLLLLLLMLPAKSRSQGSNQIREKRKRKCKVVVLDSWRVSVGGPGGPTLVRLNKEQGLTVHM